ncbi:hypothetical protein EBB04_19295 [Sinorhizobium meliloti]|nr:hypothetical protein EBB04_19295 [Sinorhizobium meliloti]
MVGAGRACFSRDRLEYLRWIFREDLRKEFIRAYGNDAVGKVAKVADVEVTMTVARQRLLPRQHSDPWDRSACPALFFPSFQPASGNASSMTVRMLLPG